VKALKIGGIELDDLKIIYEIRNGSSSSIVILIDRYKDRLYSLCRHLEKNFSDVDDLFQDTWIKAIDRIDQYDVTRPFWTWLAAIAVNTYRDKYRRLKKKLLVFYHWDKGDENCMDMVFEQVKSKEPGPEVSAVNNEFREKLIESLSELDDKYRIPLILQYYRDMRYEDIAIAMNINIGTVKSRINEAKKRLRKVLEVKYGEQ
jgi:RNA polymerase sigma-70 factor (ECF subfamily)